MKISGMVAEDVNYTSYCLKKTTLVAVVQGGFNSRP